MTYKLKCISACFFLNYISKFHRRTLKQDIEKTNLQLKLEESHKICESLKRIVENMPTTKVKQKLVETQVSKFYENKPPFCLFETPTNSVKTFISLNYFSIVSFSASINVNLKNLKLWVLNWPLVTLSLRHANV